MKKSTIGLAPGTLIYDGPQQKTHFCLWTFRENSIEKKEGETLQTVLKKRDPSAISWLQITGLGDLKKIQAVGETFAINRLMLEDVLNQNQRPKVEFSDTGDFLVVKRLVLSRNEMHVQQLSFFWSQNLIISFQDSQEPHFEKLVERFEKKRSRLFRLGTPYLGYALLDFLVDEYFWMEELLEKDLEEIAREMAPGNSHESQTLLHEIRVELLAFRRSVLPLVEMIDQLMKHHRYTEGKQSLKPYLMDLQDHVLQVTEFIRTYSDTLESLSNLAFSLTAEKTNSVMKVLTALTITFLPLTFLAGIYGMNFKYMPELDLAWAYPAVLVAMLVIAVTILLIFRWKRWI